MGILHSTPSIVVTLARVALALSLSPLAAAAGAGVLFFSCPRRLWEVLVDESDKVDEKKKKKKRKVLAALLLVPIGALLSIPLGLICGVFFALLCALFGPGAPEEPLSCDSYSKTRHDTLSEEEVEATQLKKSEEENLTFDAIELEKGKHTLHCNIVAPKKKKPKGVMIVQHGLHCHGGAPRSLRVAIHFAKEGWICYLPDCVGHGRSSGSWAVVESLEDLAQNLAFVARECSNRHPGLPMFLNGESMGGLLVLYSPNFMDQSTLEKVTGILAVCPALMVHDDAGDPIMEQFIRLWPLDLVKQIFPKFPATPGPKGNIFSSDEDLNTKAQESIDADPLEYTGNTKFATATTFMQKLLTERARKELLQTVMNLDKPLLILHGSGDRCVDIASSLELYDGVKSTNKDLIQYEGKAHVLLSEDEATRTKFLSDMTTFANNLI